MQMKLKKLTTALLVAAPIVFTSFSGFAMDKVTLKLAHNLDNSHVVHKALAAMAEEIIRYPTVK